MNEQFGANRKYPNLFSVVNVDQRKKIKIIIFWPNYFIELLNSEIYLFMIGYEMLFGK